MYLVLGAGGFLGSYVVKHILSDTEDAVVAVTRNSPVFQADSPRVETVLCDLCGDIDLLLCRLRKLKGLKVIDLAAQHNIDKVAADPEAAYKINVRALDRLLSEVNFSRFLFASSDTVYGEGGGRLFREADPTKPLSIYGEQKLLGEGLVTCRGGTALRLPFMFGRSLTKAKEHFCDVLTGKLLSGEGVEMFTNSLRSTLSFDTVAEAVVSLCEIRTDLPPVINIAGDEALSKYDVGLRLAESLGVSLSLVKPVSFRGTWSEGAQRAESTLMSNALVKSLTKQELRFTL